MRTDIRRCNGRAECHFSIDARWSGECGGIELTALAARGPDTHGLRMTPGVAFGRLERRLRVVRVHQCIMLVMAGQGMLMRRRSMLMLRVIVIDVLVHVQRRGHRR
jgi:hypothetical protein